MTIIEQMNKRIRERSPKITVAAPKTSDHPERTPLPAMQTRTFFVKGEVESEQFDASDRRFLIEIRVRARHRSEKSVNPSDVELQSLLDEQVKLHLYAIAEQYPQALESNVTPDEAETERKNLLEVLRTIIQKNGSRECRTDLGNAKRS